MGGDVMILSDEILIIAEECGAYSPVNWPEDFAFNEGDLLKFARAIEAAVLAELKKQEPVAMMASNGEVSSNSFVIAALEAKGDTLTPLYTHQQPIDEVAKDAERYRWLRRCMPWSIYENITRKRDAKSHNVDEKLDAAIDAAMKGGE